MSRVCCVEICPNAEANADPSVGYHPFPEDAEQRSKWVEFVRADPTDFEWWSKYVCSAHFLELGISNGKATLLEDAIPIIYSPEDMKEEILDYLSEEDTTMVKEVIIDESQLEESVEMRIELAPENTKLRTRFCRLCLKKRSELISLDTKLHTIPLIDVIDLITGLTIEPSEELPTMVCGGCIRRLDDAYSVYLDFNNYDKVLRQMIESKQLENHYRFYDQTRYKDAMVQNKDYVSILKESLKQESFPEEKLTEVENDISYEINSNKSSDEISEDEEIEAEQPEPNTEPDDLSYKSEPESKSTIVYKINEQLPVPKLVPNTCYICADHSSFQDVETLSEHQELHHFELPYTCATCNTDEFPAVFKTLIGLNRHLKAHLYPYRCDYCWVQSPSLQAYRDHIRYTHESLKGDGFTCETCGDHFRNRKALLSHASKHRAFAEERFKCSYCGKLFSTQKLMVQHERIHTGEKPFECNKCGKRFNHSYNYQTHVARHIGAKAHRCEQCDEGFTNKTDLKAHMAKHFPDDPRYMCVRPYRPPGPKKSRHFRCNEQGCDYTCTSYQGMANHRERHAQPSGSFVCDTCLKPFSSRQNLTYHVQTQHAGARPEARFHCTHCPKSFTANSKLQEHINMHENKRAFQCRYCEKSFVQKANCAAHERIHTGELPYPCRGCAEKFNTSSVRKKHEKKRHPELVGTKS